jgi:hypothetical protein
MEQENNVTLDPDFMRTQLKLIANMELSELAAENFGLFVGLVATMNMLQPEGYTETFPAFTFYPIKE